MTINAEGSGPTAHRIEHPVSLVWGALRAAFDSVGVPVTRVDEAQRLMGNEGFKIRQRLGGVYLSRYIDCGQTQVGPNADSYEVFMVLLVQARPASAADEASQLVINFEASARPLSFSQGYSRCSTSAVLERKLLAAVLSRLR
jgi:hypothetical protein